MCVAKFKLHFNQQNTLPKILQKVLQKIMQSALQKILQSVFQNVSANRVWRELHHFLVKLADHPRPSTLYFIFYAFLFLCIVPGLVAVAELLREAAAALEEQRDAGYERAINRPAPDCPG